jgi:hypothetical protein
MHFHLPKPLHGWREFAGEVGIIVVGVLIALGAEQVVETIRWRTEAAEAEDTLDTQLVASKFAAYERIKFEACEARQLDRLDDLVTGSASPKVRQITLSPIRLWSTSAWESAVASGAVAHMSPERRDLYAHLFNFTDTLRDMNSKEFDIVGEVRLLDRPRTLSANERDHLIEDIARLRQFNSIITRGARQWLASSEPLHLKLRAESVAELREREPCIMPDAGASKDG